ncbi:MAG: CCA tRNA nucleotidyltransferase [Euryarchaeota archaeon]|nr:CCA tRNA nucleotidyltransferase [Euryarchaeota archaeon]
MIEILKKIAPSESEKEKFIKTAGKLLAGIEKEVKKIDSRISAALLGSASRDTWLRHEKDIDLFLLFPLEYEKNELEKIVTKIGRKILEKPEKRYAEHPYIKGFYEDFEVEVVPCYAVESPSNLKSAVDRTPFHDAFLKEHIKGKENEARLLKQFLTGISCYGAEAKVEGFSGYLCELLIAKYGSFENVLKAAQNWRRREIIHFGNVGDEEEVKEKFPSSLIFIDPVDVNRNVASALSEQKLSKFIFAAGEYLKKPRREFFFPRKRAVNRKALLKKFKQRGTGLLALTFSKPDVVDDILYTQLKKTLNALKGILEGRDFCVVGIDCSVSNRIFVFIELESLEIPAARLHLGPEVNTLHERKFLEKYESYKDKLTEPFIIGSRWAIFLKRENDAKKFLQEFLSRRNLEERGIPSHVAKSLKKGFSIKINEGAFLEEFLPALQEYFDPRFAWER